MIDAENDFRQHLSSLKRGLRGLSLLSERGSLTVTEFSRELGVPRTTAHRVLETLAAEGYAERIPYQHGYRLTPAIWDLARGFSDEHWIVHVASPILFQETGKIRWPLFIATRSGEHMVVQVSTDQESPHALDHYRCGHKVPVMFCSSGHVMLAFCPPAERREILDLLKKSNDPFQHASREHEYVNGVLERASLVGYASVTYPEYSEAGLSVPIFVNGLVKASLHMIYIKTAVSEDQLTSRYAPALKGLAERIGKEVETLKLGARSQERQAAARRVG